MTKKEFKKYIKVGSVVSLIWGDDSKTTAIVLGYSNVRECGDISVKCFHSNGNIEYVVHTQICEVFPESSILPQLKELEEEINKD